MLEINARPGRDLRALIELIGERRVDHGGVIGGAIALGPKGQDVHRGVGH